jgi:hypothetical protein
MEVKLSAKAILYWSKEDLINSLVNSQTFLLNVVNVIYRICFSPDLI